MPESQLKIRPRFVGNAEGEIDETRQALDRLADEQDIAMREGRVDVEALENKYQQLEAQMHDTRGETLGMQSAFHSLFGVAAAGFAAYQGGKTFLDLTVGSADEMNRRQRQLGQIFKDADKAMARSRKLTEEVASMSLGDAVKGMQSLGVKAGGSAEKAAELVKTGKALEQLNTEQGFEGAVLAIKELMSGSKRSVVDRFNLARDAFPDRAEAKKLAEERGTTMQQVFLEALRDQLGELGGIEFLLENDRNSLRGQMQMLETAGRDVMRAIGDEALPEVTSSLKVAADELRALSDDPEFRQAAKEFGQWMGSAAESIADVAPMLIRKIPGAMKIISSGAKTVGGVLQSAKDFYDAHPTLVKTLGGLVAAKGLTGGLSGGLGGILGGGGLLGGGGKCCEGMSQAADTLTDLASGASSGAGRSFLQRVLFAGSSSAASSFTGSTMAAMTPSAGGSIAAMAAPFAVGAAGLASFADSKRDPTETAKNPVRSSTKTTNAIMNQLTKGNPVKAKKAIIEAAGGAPDERFSSEAQAELLESVNTRLESFGLRANLKKGQKFRDIQFKQAGGLGHQIGTFFGAADTELSDISDLTGEKAVEQLNTVGTEIQEVNVKLVGNDNPAQVKKKAKEGAEEGISEAVRKKRARE